MSHPPTPPTHTTASRPAEPGAPQGVGLCAALGALLCAIAPFLSWYRSPPAGGAYTQNGWGDIEVVESGSTDVEIERFFEMSSPYGPLLAVSAIALAVAAVLVLTGRAARLGFALAAFAGPVAVATTVVAVWYLDYPWNRDGFYASAEPGIWVLVAAGVTGLVTSLLALLRLARG